MTTHYKHITNVEPSFFVLCKDGKIRCNTKHNEVIGSWQHTNPRKEHKKYYTRGNNPFVDNLWTGGLNYKGTAYGYTRKEFKENLCALVSIKGIEIIESITDD